MSRRKIKAAGRARAPHQRQTHGRQRQRLIDACISALHLHGPSRTTVEKVVAIAKMSPGIVRFYFDSKAAMLVASLKYLAIEFEQQVIAPVSKLKSTPVAALELLVNLYLDPDIASPRKVSVWYSFWGEASSRQEYYDICGQKDEGFADLVRDLIGRLIHESAQVQLDPDGIALGLIGVLEILWQEFAFQNEENIDRTAAKRRCMAYLKSVFPQEFCASRADAAGAPSLRTRFAGWTYVDARAQALEREAIFAGAWQIAGHESQIPHAGDFLTFELSTERVLVTRDGFGRVHALRNSCPRTPHVLIAAREGHVPELIECKVHGLEFALNGRSASRAGDLGVLDTRLLQGLLLVKSPKAAGGVPFPLSPALTGLWVEGLLSLETREVSVAANWKVLIEQCLEAIGPDARAGAAESLEWTARPLDEATGWTSRHYRRLLGHSAQESWTGVFVGPNQLLERRPDGMSIFQVLPTAPGCSRVRRLEFTQCGAPRTGRALRYLAERLRSKARKLAPIAESIQRGIADFGYLAAHGGDPANAVGWFRRQLAARAPALVSDLAPSDKPPLGD